MGLPVSAAGAIIGLNVAELEGEILAALTEHAPHGGDAAVAKADEGLIGEFCFWVIAGSHGLGIAVGLKFDVAAFLAEHGLRGLHVRLEAGACLARGGLGQGKFFREVHGK